MSLILKTDTAVTRFIADISGLKDTDYFVNADLARQEYSLAGSPVSFADVFNYTRTGLAYKYNGSSIDTVAENTPIFGSYNADDNGLWSSPLMGSILGGGVVNTTKTVTLAGRVGLIATFIVWGSGSVTITGDVEQVDGKGLVATAGNPIRIKLKANATTPTSAIITTTVTGDVTHYQAATDTAYAANHPTFTTVQAPTMFLAPSVLSQLTSFTVLVRFKNYFIGKPNVPVRYLEIDTNNNAMTLRSTTNGLSSVRLSDGSSFVDTAGQITEDEVIFALSYSAGQMKVFSNGELKGQMAGNPASVLANIQLLNSTKFTDGAASKGVSGLLKNVVIYKKSMTDEQLKSLSNSFKW